MLKIAICDDMRVEVDALKAHIDRYARESSLSVEIDACTEPQDILEVLSRADKYDCLFLDTYMDKLNGIDLTQQLCKKGDKSRIIFFSTSLLFQNTPSQKPARH